MSLTIKPWVWVALFFTAGIAAGLGIFRLLPSVNPPSSRINVSPTVIPSTPEALTVSRVIDGDTIELTSGRRVRYIGVDTPESVDPRKGVECFAKEAAEKNRELVLGKIVALEKDVSETDRYGRLLRYVYLTTGEGQRVMINETLVREGYAFARSFPPDIKYQSQLLKAEETARQENKGLWASCPVPSSLQKTTEKGNITINNRIPATM